MPSKPTQGTKCPICPLEGNSWVVTTKTDYATNTQLVDQHIIDTHADYRFFCNIPGCTFSVPYLNRRNVRFIHAQADHGRRYEGETLRKIESFTNVASTASIPGTSSGLYPMPYSSVSASNHPGNAPAPLPSPSSYPAQSVVPDAYVTTFSTLYGAFEPADSQA
ncbi:hypothetical protein CYLTODRAFT_453434 [Cylindrobasidium torrendii FP15055 ss-10]|uniref:Uncharacterized protein n=1 Tax=Cylindrobasidium torrendii FP15055 ss-10 TaxID=1314674 RepID=A0A0D7BEI7_9AGAR|nr:hypothetical protein CYLTODRAFT_453434 [Cylindrobasidium torrendii FP15055 ss-10]